MRLFHMSLGHNVAVTFKWNAALNTEGSWFIARLDEVMMDIPTVPKGLVDHRS